MRDETYTGQAVTITIHAGRCIHSRNCVLGQPDVWVANAKGGWVHPDAAPAEVVAAVAQSCPSGAISYQRHDSGPEEAAPAVNGFACARTARWRCTPTCASTATPWVTARRCAAAALHRKKPFCDGSHQAAGFQASGEPASAESNPLARRNGALEITPKPNGPLKVDGPVELCSGTGRTVTRGEQMFLCRCGGSANKPFCDGSHKRIGFSSA